MTLLEMKQSLIHFDASARNVLTKYHSAGCVRNGAQISVLICMTLSWISVLTQQLSSNPSYSLSPLLVYGTTVTMFFVSLGQACIMLYT